MSKNKNKVKISVTQDMCNNYLIQLFKYRQCASFWPTNWHPINGVEPMILGQCHHEIIFFVLTKEIEKTFQSENWFLSQ